MKRWKIILAFVAVFLAGALVGGVTVMRFVPPPFHGPPNEAEMTEHLMRMLKSELHLTPDQAARIQPIVVRVTQQMIGFHQEVAGRMDESIDASDREIAACLDPAQKVKFAEICAKRPRMKRNEATKP